MTGSLEDVAIQAVASKSSSSIVPLEDVPHFVPSDGNKGHRREGGSLRLSLVEGVPQPLGWVNFGDRDPSCTKFLYFGGVVIGQTISYVEGTGGHLTMHLQ